MKAPLKLSLTEARLVTLRAQGLAEERPYGAGAKGAASAIEHLGYVQLDTISVVERAHHHVLWTRVPDYRPAMLNELLARGEIFEYWSHAAALLPMRDYRFSLRRKEAIRSGKQSHWHRRNRPAMAMVLDRVRAEGPLQARDFEAAPGKKRGVWFSYKPAKIALEQLFMEGDLMIRERRGFQKVFDLTERVLPASVDTRRPTDPEFARHLIESAIRSHGFATEGEIHYLRRTERTAVIREVRQMLSEGELIEVKVENSEAPYLSTPRTLEKYLARRPAASAPAAYRILSPFDNAVIQRQRLADLYGYDYQIECYVPEPKRKFGYFALPVLKGDRLVARIDAKADRAEKKLIVRRIAWERGNAFLKKDPGFREELERFARFNGCEAVALREGRRENWLNRSAGASDL